MAKPPLSGIITLVSMGASVTISAKTYNPAEISTLVNGMDDSSFLILKDASSLPVSALSSILQQARGRVILDFT